MNVSMFVCIAFKLKILKNTIVVKFDTKIVSGTRYPILYVLGLSDCQYLSSHADPVQIGEFTHTVRFPHDNFSFNVNLARIYKCKIE